MPDHAPHPGIHVTGEGRVSGTPDTMTISMGVSLTRARMEQATSDAATLASAIIAAVTATGVAAGDVQTTRYDVAPEIEWAEGSQRTTGYRVTNEVQIKVRDVATAGDVIDAATTAGGDETVLSGLAFAIEDNTALLERARAAAWADAEAKATQLAALAGVEVGDAVAITETVGHPALPVVRARAMAAEAMAPPIEAGTSDVMVTLDVSFAIG